MPKIHIDAPISIFGIVMLIQSTECERQFYYVKCRRHVINHLELVSLWDKIYPFNLDVYMFLLILDIETRANVFLGEALVDLVQLLPEDDRTLFWYLCLPALHAICSRYHHVIV